jgi:hypothetical protein
MGEKPIIVETRRILAKLPRKRETSLERGFLGAG